MQAEIWLCRTFPVTHKIHQQNSLQKMLHQNHPLVLHIFCIMQTKNNQMRISVQPAGRGTIGFKPSLSAHINGTFSYGRLRNERDGHYNTTEASCRVHAVPCPRPHPRNAETGQAPPLQRLPDHLRPHRVQLQSHSNEQRSLFPRGNGRLPVPGHS